MGIVVLAKDFNLTEALQAYIKERIQFQFGSRYDQIQRITIRLSDVNGPRGGVDKSCKVSVTLPRLKEIVIEDIQADLYVGIYRAMDRASRTVNRRLARLSNKKRRLYVPNQSNRDVMLNGRYVYS